MVMFFTDDDKWNALVQRNVQSNGVFFYGVLTTGVYCRPICASRLPNRRNVRYFDTCEEAEKAGFHPCKRCHPNDKDWQDSQTLAVLNACRIIENADNPLNLEDIAARIHLSTFHFQRLFKKILGVTPKKYAMEVRLKRTRACLQSGQTVTEAIYHSGFESASRFYEKSTAILGMSPSAYKNGAPDIQIQHAVVQSYIGWVLVASTEKGVCSVSIGDTPEKLKADLYRRFPKAKFKNPDPNFEDILAKVLAFIEAPHSRSFELPLDILGTAFQRRVWDALQGIAPGSTASYTEIATRIGNPSAARAVAQACAANPIAVVIPCHRVVRSDGKPGGYRWDVERKSNLLARENKKTVGAT
ncbi:MAG: bifunctional DNA-binding transcriptional regulator/O6-methylguanine-DNA methyltransferase Ada [Desulfobacterales bacterium]|nr:bifunctional DNA-binding transcriptional regulator/O6-methylguanine-DNA methyltransferase Ada [Desulfobacterales bacterium]